jgi:outer membrane protein assembly factor BamD (BamD/ComL family)
VIEHFQGAPVMPRALDVLLQSYNALGLQSLAADIRRIIEVNYGTGETALQSP